MIKRPLQVTLIALLYALTGAFGLVQHSLAIKGQRFEYYVIPVLLTSLLAIIAGVYMFLCKNWARWLSVGWIALHVVISIFHKRQELVMHVVVLALFAYLLFRPECNTYFPSTTIEGK